MDGDTPERKTKRLTLEKGINDHYLAGDMVQVDNLLGIYPHKKPRHELTAQEMIDRYQGRPEIQKFFEAVIIPGIADQPTDEFEAVNLEDYA